VSKQSAAVLLALALLLSLPIWLGGGYYVNIASQVLIWGIFASALNVLVGWGGLVSLGHAGIFGFACYSAAWLASMGWGHLPAAAVTLVATLVVTACFGLLALRATGIGFLMITLAIGQILWGIAYRWIALTNGDNGIIVRARPSLLGFSLVSSTAFYFFTLGVFLAALYAMRVFNRSPFGASLRGTRDQPRRMSALGFNVWLIRWLAVMFSGLWSAVAGLLYVYYQQFVSPHVLALTSSAEVLLMVIAGGPGTLLGPAVGAALVVVMKTVASAYVERWNLVLGAIFVAIVIFVPEGLVPGSRRLWQWASQRLRRVHPGGRSSVDPER
jgi:branched-chain amino acid transport system permease protein